MTRLEQLEAAFSAACQDRRNAERARKRSNSHKNVMAYIAADDAWDVAHAAFMTEQTRCNRLARLAAVRVKLNARRAAAVVQFDLLA